MAATLYTSRIVLSTLGITDFGIFNAVGGLVAMMGFLNSSMANAVQRFLSFEIGRNNEKGVNLIFNISLQIHIIIALVVFFIIEGIGVWFLYNKMNIPADRMTAAFWVFQCAVVVSMFSVIQVPYNAIIIAKEQMNVFAYISILEVILKLMIVYLLVLWNIDKLILYSILTMGVSFLIITMYFLYCVGHYPESRIHYIRDAKTAKNMAWFASWNMLGEVAWIFTGQGVNLLLNIFFGPAINAARGVAYQVETAVMKFVNSFQMALNPQIIKTYAVGEQPQTIKLVYQGTRFSFYLLMILSIPLLFEMDYVLGIWLYEVPPLTTQFTQLVLICSLVQCMSNLFATVAKAYGKIRKYQLVISTILFLNFPISFILLKTGFSPLYTVMTAILIQIVTLVARLILTKKMIVFSIREFLVRVFIPLSFIFLLGCIIPLFITYNYTSCFVRFVTNTLLSELSLLLIIYHFGLNKNERTLIIRQLSKIRSRI